MLLDGVWSGRGMEIGSEEWKKFWEDYMYVFKRNKDTYKRKAFLHRKAKEDAREIALILPRIIQRQQTHFVWRLSVFVRCLQIYRR
jgi:hypothetical protein